MLLTEYAGEKILDKLTTLVGQQGYAAKITAAFTEADQCFAQKTSSPNDKNLHEAILSLPLARLEALEQMAARLPQNLDEASFRQALRATFRASWPKQLSEAEIDRAADLYVRCLDRPLAADCEQLLPTLFRKVERIEQGVEKLLAGQEQIKATLVDVQQLVQLGPRRWRKPEPPTPQLQMVGRRTELQAVAQLLQPGTRAAITAAVQGLPGIGKTLLAENLALELAPRFPGGVIFTRLGYGHRQPEQCWPILNTWGALAFDGQPLPEGVQLTAEAVRNLLADNGALLIVLDDVWELSAIKPLREALPREACLLITTRDERLARDLDGALYALDVLTSDDAVALLRARASQAIDADKDLLEKLAEKLGRHALALDLAGRALRDRSRAEWPNVKERIVERLQSGGGFGDLPFPGQEERRVKEVEAVLALSYEDLPNAARERFESLGAFAPDASFRAEAVAMAWECQSLEEAQGALVDFANRGLLTRTETAQNITRWSQHSLLRTYALALLARAGKADEARTRHAQTHNALMQALDNRQVYYQLLPDYAQLKHAFEWAINHDLGLAQAIASNTANLQAAFYLVRDHFAWAEQLVRQVRPLENKAQLGAALVTLGNALARLANLANEDRRARLLQALQAYDEALLYRRPDTAPLAYAATQNNRANQLSAIATLPGEDRRARLLQALQAYDEALLHYRPDTAPLDYAMTQSNLANWHLAMAALPEENQREHWRAALGCAYTAFQFFNQLGHTPYIQHAARQLVNIAERIGPLFTELWAELDIGEPPQWLAEALAEQAVVKAVLQFVNAPTLAEMRALVEAQPSLSTSVIESIFENLLAHYQAEAEAVQHLTARRDILRACRERGVAAAFDELE